jgi:hypothetical protein
MRGSGRALTVSFRLLLEQEGGPMVTSAIAPDIDRYWNSIGGAAPVYTPEEQRSALTLCIAVKQLSEF